MPILLVLKNLLSHPVRSLLTLGSIVVAVFLVSVLRAVVTGLEAGVESASADRLVVQSAVSLFVNMPQSYQDKIAQVEGVEHVCKWQWFQGIYQDPSNFFPQFGVDAEPMLAMYPEYRIVAGSAEEFRRNRDACLVGVDLAERFGWKVGDTVPLMGTIFPRTDGSAWEFRVAALFESSKSAADNGLLFFHFEYLSEAIESGASGGPAGVGVYVFRVTRGVRVEEVMRRVDALFENGPQRVQTTTEEEFGRQFITMLGNVPGFIASIGAGVLFAIFLAALNTMLMAGRERTHSIGVLKAMGFTDRTVFGLLVLESLCLCGLAGAFGVGLTLAIEPGLKAVLGAFLPGFDIDPQTSLMGLGLSLAVGLFAGLLPAWRASRLDPVSALRADL